MSKLFIEDTTLSAIGDAIREKTGGTELIAPLDMPTAIGSITTGGGGGGLTEWTCSSLAQSGAYTHATSNGQFDEYIDGKPFTLNILMGMSYLFASCYSLKDLSKMVINYSGYNAGYRMFISCNELTSLPKLNVAADSEKMVTNFEANFQYCYKLRNINNDFWQAYMSLKDNNGSDPKSYILPRLFNGCYSLRQLPDMTVFDNIVSSQSSSSNQLYYNFAYECYALDTIEYMPVINFNRSITSNMFSYTFNSCRRVKDIIFATDNGTPKVRTWSNQTIDLSDYVGYGDSYYLDSITTSYNSGITKDKQVKDDATYAALKNDPDWFSLQPEYSRYNHDSAVRTINSLPDCSSGSGNTIMFKGAAGSATDGGAINTLTEAEIAVATAKGWTVSLV